MKTDAKRGIMDPKKNDKKSEKPTKYVGGLTSEYARNRVLIWPPVGNELDGVISSHALFCPGTHVSLAKTHQPSGTLRANRNSRMGMKKKKK